MNPTYVPAASVEIFNVQRPEAERITSCTPTFTNESAETKRTLPVTTGVPFGLTASTTKFALSFVVIELELDNKVAVVGSLKGSRSTSLGFHTPLVNE